MGIPATGKPVSADLIDITKIDLSITTPTVWAVSNKKSAAF